MGGAAASTSKDLREPLNVGYELQHRTPSRHGLRGRVAPVQRRGIRLRRTVT